MWLCPFKAVTEFPQVRCTQTAIQFGVFIALFLGLVVVLPFLTSGEPSALLLPVRRFPVDLQPDQHL